MKGTGDWGILVAERIWAYIEKIIFFVEIGEFLSYLK